MNNKLYIVGLCAAVAFAFGCKKKDENKNAKKPNKTAPKTTARKTTPPPKKDPPAAKATSQKGKVQLTFVFTVKPDQVAEGDRLFASHAAWMAKSHHKDGKLALHRYNVAKGAVKEKSLDPSSKDTANVNFVLTEVYETPEGVADHWKQATAKEGGWADFKAFMAWAKKTKVTAMHGAPVAHSLW